MPTTVKPVKLDLDRLEAMAESDYYNPYTIFDWPETLDESLPWMSEDLVTLKPAPRSGTRSPASSSSP